MRRAAPVLRSVARVAAPIAGVAAVMVVARRYAGTRDQVSGKSETDEGSPEGEDVS
jgi:hypothetical protein